MNTLTESELVLASRSQAIKGLNIIQNQTGKFFVTASLNNREGDFTLLTFRKTPREWASLDRLARHIQENYQPTPPIKLILY